MKILLIHNFYRVRGGEGTHFLQMKSLLEKKGHTVLTYSRDSREVDDYSFLKKAFVPIKNIYSFKTYRQIKNIVLSEKPDIAQVYHVTPLITPSVFPALHRLNIPVIQILQNYRYLCLNGIFQDPQGNVCELCTQKGLWQAVPKKCYRDSLIQTLAIASALHIHRKLNTYQKNIDLFITTSAFLRNKLIFNGFPEDRVKTINGFTEAAGFTPCFQPEPYIVYMGRLSSEKGLFTLLKAMRGLPDIQLKILGDGPIKISMEEYLSSERMNNVEFLGYVSGDERFEVLKRAKCMVIPSECYDNFPFGVLESLALGTPVIGSCMGGIPEQIEDGKTGFLFQAKNYQQLREKIEKIFNDGSLSISMRRNARMSALNKFSQETAYQRFMNIYKDLIQLKKN